MKFLRRENSSEAKGEKVNPSFFFQFELFNLYFKIMEVLKIMNKKLITILVSHPKKQFQTKGEKTKKLI